MGLIKDRYHFEAAVWAFMFFFWGGGRFSVPQQFGDDILAIKGVRDWKSTRPL